MDVLTYQCPQCGAPLMFHEETQRWDCEYCLGSFDLETLEKKQAAESQAPEGNLAEAAGTTPPNPEIREYTCPQCGAHIVTDATTAATFCVFCQNAAIFPEQLSGTFRPEKLIPFQVKKEAAQEAFKRLCRRKPLLPKDFCTPDRIEKITGVYVPFWLYDCAANSYMTANAQRVHTWSDSRYRYTKTDHYRIERGGTMDFDRIPADGSSKMDDALMDAIEPYDMGKLVDFSTAYLSGFMAERYDENSEDIFPRASERMRTTVENVLRNTISGYASVQIAQNDVQIQRQATQNVLLPVWMLMSRYRDKEYLFAMNGQTGKLIGNLPISIPRAVAWFAGILAAVFLLLFLGGMLL